MTDLVAGLLPSPSAVRRQLFWAMGDAGISHLKVSAFTVRPHDPANEKCEAWEAVAYTVQVVLCGPQELVEAAAAVMAWAGLTRVVSTHSEGGALPFAREQKAEPGGSVTGELAGELPPIGERPPVALGAPVLGWVPNDGVPGKVLRDCEVCGQPLDPQESNANSRTHPGPCRKARKLQLEREGRAREAAATALLEAGS